MFFALKAGGPDPAVNGKLRDRIAKAKSLNVPNDNCSAYIIKSHRARKKTIRKHHLRKVTAPMASP